MSRVGPPEHTPEQELRLRQQAKQQLRDRMRSLRRQLPAEARQARSERIVERVRALDAFERAGTLLSFVAIRAEADPSALLAAARAAGKQCALPRVEQDTGRLAVHRWDEGDLLERGAFGVPEPSPSAPTVPLEQLDLVVVPALALDERGHRIGYGKGFYDLLLPTLPNAVRCAVAYDFQLVAEVPEMPGDERVDVIVTDARVLELDRHA